MASFVCHYKLSQTFSCSIFLLVLLLFCINLSRAQTVPAMYVFGDSLVDVGNNNYLPLSIIKADFPYNGIDYRGHMATGRFSNGKNAADLLAEKVGLSTPPPFLSEPNGVFLKGVSFASGGAGIFNPPVQSLIKDTIPLAHQVAHFSTVRQQLVKELGSTATQEHLSKSLFPIIIGSNDIINYFKNDSVLSKTNNSPQQHVTLMASTLKQLLKGIYDLGARKFLVIGLSPIGCAPRLRYQNTTNGCREEVNYWSNKYNQELTQMLSQLKSELKEFQYSYFDAYTVFLKFIQSPATYGFKETKAACCGLGTLRASLPCTPLAVVCSNRNDHLFWDIYHPTEAAARTFINMLYNDNSGDYVSPITLKQLLAT